MSNAQLIHIFDNSTCLSKRQMKDYVKGIMANEEAHAVEVHLNSCPMCSDAIEGLFEQQEGGLAAMNDINSDFLKDHFGLSNPQVHLNSMAAAQPARNPNIHYEKKKNKVQPIWRTTSIAAALLLLVALVWFYRISREEIKPTSEIAQDLSKQEPAVMSPSESPARPSSVIAMNDAKSKKTVTPATAEPQATEAAKAFATTAKQADAAPMNFAAAPAITEDSKPATAAEKEDVVTAYRKPVVAEEERKMVTSEEIEKMPSRNTESVASSSTGVYQQKSFGNASDRGNTNAADKKEEGALSLGGARSEGTAYKVEAAKAKTAKRIAKTEETEPDKLAQADKLYDRKSYNDALHIYNREAQSADKGRSQQGSLGAAKCYLALGNKVKAKQLLQSLADNASGSVKRQAKRLLNEME